MRWNPAPTASTAAPPEPLHEHDRVAAVAVGAEQLGVDQSDANGGVPRRAHRNLRYSDENWVYDDTMFTSSPGSLAAASSASCSTMWSTSAYRSRTATSSARSPAAAMGCPRSNSYGTSHNQDGSLPSATRAFTAMTTEPLRSDRWCST